MATILPLTSSGIGGMLFGGGTDQKSGVDPYAPVDVGGGKSSRQQNLQSPHSGIRSSLAGGELTSRAMGHYGKGHSFSSAMGISGKSGRKAF